MSCYLEKLDCTPKEQQWALVRGWMDEDPLGLYKELRASRPVLVMPELTMVTRFADCTSVLRQYSIFSVQPYESKQPGYWMAEDDTAVHWREKSIMRSILDLEDLAGIRAFVAEQAATILKQANGHIDAVNDLCRAVPIALVQGQFGFDQSDPKKLIDWSFWNQYDAFRNQPFDSVVEKDQAGIIAKREAAGEELKAYLIALVTRRGAELKAGKDNNDPATRLLRLSMSGALKFDIPRVITNVGGLLIGAVETTAIASIYALSGLLSRPEVLEQARAAAAKDDPQAFDGFVFEALRFRPAFPYFFRRCEQATELAAGTEYATDIPKGAMVLAITHAGMFDDRAFPNPDTFDPTRPQSNMFHFGLGIHACLGEHIGRQMIPEIVRQALLIPDLKATGPIDFNGTVVPEHYPLQWDSA